MRHERLDSERSPRYRGATGACGPGWWDPTMPPHPRFLLVAGIFAPAYTIVDRRIFLLLFLFLFFFFFITRRRYALTAVSPVLQSHILSSSLSFRGSSRGRFSQRNLKVILPRYAPTQSSYFRFRRVFRALPETLEPPPPSPPPPPPPPPPLPPAHHHRQQLSFAPELASLCCC